MHPGLRGQAKAQRAEKDARQNLGKHFLTPFNGALYIMVHHLMVRYIVSIRHFLTLYGVNKTLFDAI